MLKSEDSQLLDTSIAQEIILEVAKSLKTTEVIAQAAYVAILQDDKSLAEDKKKLHAAMSQRIRLFLTAQAILTHGIADGISLQKEGISVIGSVDITESEKVSVFRINRKVAPSIEIPGQENNHVQQKPLTEKEAIQTLLLPQAISVALEKSGDQLATSRMRPEEGDPLLSLVAQKILNAPELAENLLGHKLAETVTINLLKEEVETRLKTSSASPLLQKLCQISLVEYRATNPRGLVHMSSRAQCTVMAIGTEQSLLVASKGSSKEAKEAELALAGLNLAKAPTFLSEGRISTRIPSCALTHLILPYSLNAFVKFLEVPKNITIIVCGPSLCGVKAEYAYAQSAPKISLSVQAPSYDQSIIEILRETKETALFAHIVRIIPEALSKK